tara:strand:+ start:1850 stop:1984 length:135 start_codon:yes stop_codon:yes gene_type:complete
LDNDEYTGVSPDLMTAVMIYRHAKLLKSAAGSWGMASFAVVCDR